MCDGIESADHREEDREAHEVAEGRCPACGSRLPEENDGDSVTCEFCGDEWYR